MSVVRRCVTLSLGIICIVLACSAHAGEPLTAETQVGRPPDFREAFTEDAVRTLLATIQDKDAVSILKFGYFVNRKHHPCPKEQGLKLLQEALQKEPVGEARWCTLQALYAFACFHTPSGPKQEGYLAYRTLFENLREPREGIPPEVACQAVRDLIGIVANADLSGLRREGGLSEAASSALAKGYEAWLVLWCSGATRTELVLRPLRWGSRLDSSGIREVVEQYVLKANGTKDFRTLIGLAVGAACYDASRCAELLTKAEKLLPANDPKEAQAFYRKYVKALEAADRRVDAVAACERGIALTGRGYDQLAVLHLRAGDAKAFEAAFSKLKARDAEEADILTLADTLRLNKSQQENAAALLQNYLAADRERHPDSEIGARLMLARLLLKLGKPDAAIEACNCAHLDGKLTSSGARREFEEARQFVVQLTNTQGNRGRPE